MGVPPDVMEFKDDEAFWSGSCSDCGMDLSYIDAIDQIKTVQLEDPICGLQSVHYRGSLMLSVCAENGSWSLYDLEAPNQGAIQVGEHGPGLKKAELSPDLKKIISIDEDELARLWDISSDTPKRILSEQKVHAYAFSPDSQMVAMTPSRGVARVWNTEGILLASLPLKDSREHYRGLRFFNDGKHLVFAGTGSDHVNFYTLWTTDLDALYQEFSWVPELSTDSLTQ